jgi:ankyrin repeat protein
MSLLLSLTNLLSNQAFQGVNHRTLDLITEDEMFLTKFNQILLFSIANGFAGLQDIPIEKVLKHLSRYTSLNLLLLRLLQTNRSHAAKALTENLFRAAVEAGSEAVLKVLLTVGSIDVDSTLCIVDGEKYTPLERAAVLQHLRVVRLFLKTGADVNKTFASDPWNGGALGYLISGMYDNAANAPISEIVELGNLLLQAGAKVHFELVQKILQVLRYFHYDELAYSLVTRVSDIDHRKLIGGGLLSEIAFHFNDWQATDSTRKIMTACDRTECGRCLTEYEKAVEWAGLTGAKRGHLQLVQLLLPHSKSPHRALSAAIRYGKIEVIDAILALGADINAPAHDIDVIDRKIREGWDHESLTTSLAEAIKAGDERLVYMIEAAGFLNHLGQGGRFRTAIAAALKTGNINYVRKLLGCCSSPKPSDMSEAVLYAVQNDYEEIFWILLAAGADVSSASRRMPAIPTPLLAAMLRRNHRMVRGILNADVNNNELRYSYCPLRHSGEGYTVFGEAVKWGDESVFQDLRCSFPDKFLKGVELSEALTLGNAVWFEFYSNLG